MIKNCTTCAHREIAPFSPRCLRSGLEWGSHRAHCSFNSLLKQYCDVNFSGWEPVPEPPPAPPRRSLRQWFYDTFWKVSGHEGA